MTNPLNILLYSCLIFTKINSSFTFIFLRCKEGQGEGRDEGGDHPGGEDGRGDGDDWLVERQTCHTSPHLTHQGRATLVVEEADVGEAPEEEEESSADERENVELDNYRDNLFNELRDKLDNMEGKTKQETMAILT